MHCNPEYHFQLRELIAGLPIEIKDCQNIPTESIDFWIASARYESMGLHYDSQIDITAFVMEYLNCMAEECGYARPIKERREMLLDFPSIAGFSLLDEIDVLFLNVDPKSGQCPHYSSSEMDALEIKLIESGLIVASVKDFRYTLAAVGRLSTRAKMIIGCATGPFWPTMNAWSEGAKHIVMLDPQRLNYGPTVDIEHASCADGVEDILRRDGLL